LYNGIRNDLIDRNSNSRLGEQVIFRSLDILKSMKRVKDVDEYIASAPEDLQSRLKQIRKIIKDCAPKVVEKISYGMPYYGYKGRLAYFSYFQKHIGLYLTPPIIEEYKKELKEYDTSTATIRFPHKEKLPLALIKKLIKARVRKNDEAEKKNNVVKVTE